MIFLKLKVISLHLENAEIKWLFLSKLWNLPYKKESPNELSNSVPSTVLFSNSFLSDLEKIWELRYWIPDPTAKTFPRRAVCG